MFSVRTSLLLIPITLLASAPLHAGSLEDAVTLLEEGWQDRAEKQLEDLADRNPDNAEVWYQLAWARFYVNDFEGAEKNIDKAVKLDRDNPGYLILQGHSVGRRAQTGSKLKAIGRAKKCRGLYERVLEIDPGNVEAYTSLIQYLIQAPGIAGGDTDRARRLTAELEKIDQVEGLIMKGMVQEKDEDVDGALESYRRAVQVSRETGEKQKRARWAYLSTFYEYERFDEAEDFLKSENDHDGLARHYQRTGDWDAARAQFSILVAADSTRVRALEGLAYLELTREDWSAAAARFDTAYAAAPERHNLLYQASRSRLFGESALDVAASGFRDYLAHEINRAWPSEGWARVRLAEVLWKSGDQDGAQDELKVAKRHSKHDSRLKDEIDRLKKDMRPTWDGEGL
jgi:tetratricopeptide (TPR) repeat protein